MAKILVADDHEIVVEGMRMIFAKAAKGLEICGEARDGREAVEMVKTLHPDIVVLDVSMPRMSGLEAAKLISRSSAQCKILIFTMHESERLEAEVRQTGAHGYVLKSQAARDLVRAIESLLAGDTFFGTPAVEEKTTRAQTDRGKLFRISLAFA